VGNDCVVPCTSHAECAVGEDCTPATEDGTGKAVTICRANGNAGIGTPCPLGSECAQAMTCGDGTPCSASGSCAVGTCRALTCLSGGVGDAVAFCSLFDCQKDSDCGGGYWCATVRVGDQICNQPAQPAVCGMPASSSCVDPSMNASNGTTYAAGPVCTQRKECRVRGLCGPCSTDLDCSRLPGGRCVQGACATDCRSDADCVNGFQCSSGECVPRFGKCAAATGTGQLCEPCRVEADCGPGLFCAVFESNGLRACAIVPGTIACARSSDCPAAPSGLHPDCTGGKCDPVPVNAGTNLVQCFCENQGAGCQANSDCCSMNCVGANASTGIVGTCM
jgi:hypothetical protein